MRSRTAQWFECKIKYEKVMEDGLKKQVVEQYVVDALSFAEAEQRITEEMSAYISGEFEVKDIKKAAYKEIFFMSDAAKKFHNEVEDLDDMDDCYEHVITRDGIVERDEIYELDQISEEWEKKHKED